VPSREHLKRSRDDQGAGDTPGAVTEEAADLLHMKRSNVAKFLARRGVNPAFSKAQGYFWWESDI
jgi:hypothetical protein